MLETANARSIGLCFPQQSTSQASFFCWLLATSSGRKHGKGGPKSAAGQI
jgi:hypothetical protein